MSRQFDVHGFGARTANGYPTLVVVLQHDTVPGRLVVVAPFVANGVRPVLSRYSPLVRFGEQDYLIATNELAAVDKVDLGPPLGSVAHHRDAIVRALDLLFTGF